MIGKYPLMNAYWEDKAARLEKIEIPAYVVASYTNFAHSRGTFEGFERISSLNKWLRIHNSMEWPDYYNPANVEDLRRFFDRYLKGIENGWEKTPRVRLSILDPGGTDIVGRTENEFPLSRTQYKKLFLDSTTGKLSTDPVTEESMVCYNAGDGKGKSTFTIRFDSDTELTGHMKLRLWVEAEGANDMDLFVLVQKLGRNGKLLSHMVVKLPNRFMATFMKILNFLGILKLGFMFYSGPNGRLRVSHRQLDPTRSTPSKPYHTHAMEELLQPGQIVPVEIPIFPTGIRWHQGEQLCVTVTGYDLIGRMFPKFLMAPTRNKGKHIIHTGGKYDSHLLVPMIPL